MQIYGPWRLHFPLTLLHFCAKFQQGRFLKRILSNALENEKKTKDNISKSKQGRFMGLVLCTFYNCTLSLCEVSTKSLWVLTKGN